VENHSFSFCNKFSEKVVIFKKLSVRIKSTTDVFDIEVSGGQI
jgi:hypothetical protein